jgi:hypothetical protein
MPNLHLPIGHTDEDLVLAANLADIVGSEDLYVTWSHEHGPGAAPEVHAVLVEQRRANPVAGFLATVAAGFAGMCRALLGRPRRAAVRHDAPPPSDPARRAPA